MSTNVDRETQLGRSSASGTFLERLADKVGINARSSAVFGEPIERDGITVITVAKSSWGFGGGAGSGSNPGQTQMGEGSGGGAGGLISPVGYIEIRDGKARFRPIYYDGALLRLVVGVGIVTLLVLRSIRKFIHS